MKTCRYNDAVVCEHQEQCRSCGWRPRKTVGPLEWIDTRIKLPEVGKSVIICRQKEPGNPHVEAAVLTQGGWWKVYGTNVRRVDYWMPMPEPPK